MFFSKPMTISDEELGNVALAAGTANACSSEAEAEFIERLKEGDPKAFDILANRYAAEVYGLLMRLTNDAEEAADLTQETFLNALRAIKKFRGDATLKTWIFRIAINQSRNRFRWWKRRHRDQTISLDVPYNEDGKPLSETFSSNSLSPEEKTLRAERKKILREALNDLPKIFREAVILCDIEGLTYEEIATVLEINPGTVKSRIARGREELRRKLEDI